jgi:hypothetical protein
MDKFYAKPQINLKITKKINLEITFFLLLTLNNLNEQSLFENFGLLGIKKTNHIYTSLRT